MRRNYKKELEALQVRFNNLCNENAKLNINCTMIDAENYKHKSENKELRKDAEKMWWIIYDIQNFLHAKYDMPKRDIETEFFFDYIDSKCNMTRDIFHKEVGQPFIRTHEEIEKSRISLIEHFKNL